MGLQGILWLSRMALLGLGERALLLLLLGLVLLLLRWLLLHAFRLWWQLRVLLLYRAAAVQPAVDAITCMCQRSADEHLGLS